MVKMMIVGGRPSGMTSAQQRHYMQHIHGKMVVDFIGAHPELAPARYVQNHVFDGSFRATPAVAGDPFAISRDFITQVWFNSQEHAGAAMTASFYRERLQPDEENFVDQPNVVKLPVVEVEVFGADVPTGCIKLFVFHQIAPGISNDAGLESTRRLWAPLLEDGANGIERLVRNSVLNRPGQKPTVDLIDEVWLGCDEAAHKLGSKWQQAATADSTLKSVLATGGGFVLLAHEKVMFAGDRSD